MARRCGACFLPLHTHSERTVRRRGEPQLCGFILLGATFFFFSFLFFGSQPSSYSSADDDPLRSLIPTLFIRQTGELDNFFPLLLIGRRSRPFASSRGLISSFHKEHPTDRRHHSCARPRSFMQGSSARCYVCGQPCGGACRLSDRQEEVTALCF